MPSGDGDVGAQRLWDSCGRVQATRSEAWAELLEAAIAANGADCVRKQLESAELAVAGGSTSFAMFCANGPMPKAEAERSFSAWTDQFTQGDGSPEWRRGDAVQIAALTSEVARLAILIEARGGLLLPPSRALR